MKPVPCTLALLFALLPAAAWAQPRYEPAELERARRDFPPGVTRAVLDGTVPAPAGFDAEATRVLGEDRLKALRARTGEVSGLENDTAAVLLARLGVKPGSLKAPDGPRPGQGGPGGPGGFDPAHPAALTVTRTGSEYPAADGRTAGFFRTGQPADLLLSGIDFNQTGGPLLFNHPAGIASDGKRLLLADTYNNRVLVWNTLPVGNTPPDLVLGQKDFSSNDSGTGPDRMNWPVNVATDGKRVVVADTENHRLLIWNVFPERSGQAADLALVGGNRRDSLSQSKSRFLWPWGVWTDGERLAVASTQTSSVLIWNRFPTRPDQPADVLLTANGKMGTPRTITSDGRSLIVGDHNQKVDPSAGSGSFFWRRFPTRDDEPYDYFRGDPAERRHSGTWLRGCFLPEGKLLLLGMKPCLWDGFPKDEHDPPRLVLDGFDLHGGDHVGAVCAGGRLYVCTGNRNQVVVYNSVPDRNDRVPDFALGSPDLAADTLATNFIISNPSIASNGKSLFVVSDFDGKLYVWKRLPDRSGSHPDLVYSGTRGGWGIALWRETLAVAGGQTVWLWRKLPLDGELPDTVLGGHIGSVRLGQIRGVARDDRWFYLSDFEQNKVWVWAGVPGPDSEPAFALDFPGPGRLSSDGEWLAIAPFTGHTVHLYQVAALGPKAQPYPVPGPNTGPRPGAAPVPRPGGPGGAEGRPHFVNMFNMAPSAQVAHGRFFVADVVFSRVHVWRNVQDAIDGKWADVLIGAKDFDDWGPETARDRLHWPASVCFDGSYLWVGETKFSERILRFSPRPEGGK